MTHDRNQPRRPVRKARPVSWLGPSLTALIAVVVLVVLFLAGAAAESFRNKDATPTAKAGGSTPKLPGVGKAVRDGKFEFVVTQVDCSKSTVGREHLKRTAAGRFCVVSLSVRNIAGDPQLFVGSAQKAFDAAGTAFSNDEIASLYANNYTQTFVRKIDPGGRVTGKLVFDVPRTTTLTTLDLHDSPFSGGVQVGLK